MAAIEVHSIWKRRVVPARDDGWNRIEVTGIFEQGEGMNEICVRPVGDFGPVLSVPVADLEKSFDLETPAPPVAATADLLFDTGGAWI